MIDLRRPGFLSLAWLISFMIFLPNCAMNNLFDDAAQDDTASGKGDQAGQSQTNAEKNWTILVYGAGDNNLRNIEIISLSEMMRADSSDKINVLLQLDLPDKGTIRFLVKKNNTTQKDASTLLGELGHLNSADPNTLANFISWGIKNYPAKHYALFLQDHGLAWKGGLSDDSNNMMMSLPSLRQAIEKGLSQISAIPAQAVQPTTNLPSSGKKQPVVISSKIFRPQSSTPSSTLTTGSSPNKFHFDVITLHMCLMASLEVATELAPYTDYIVASEEITKSDGKVWGYFETLNYLKDHVDATAEELSQAIYEGFALQCNRKNAGLTERCNEEATYSIIKTQQVTELATKINNFAEVIDSALKDKNNQEWFAVQRARNSSEEYGKVANLQVVDLFKFTSDLARQTLPEAWKKPLQDIQETYQTVVISALKGPEGSATGQANGLSIYFPMFNNGTYDLKEELKSYAQTQFAQIKSTTGANGWSKLVWDLIQKKAADKIFPTFEKVSATKNETELWVTSKLSNADDLQSARAFLGIADTQNPEKVEVIYYLPVAPDKDHNLNARINLQKIPVITDGTSTFFASINFRATSEEDYLNKRKSLLIGEIPITVKLTNGKLSEVSGQISASYDPQTGRVMMGQPEYIDPESWGLFRPIEDETQFFVETQFLENHSSIPVDKIEKTNKDHLFTWGMDAKVHLGVVELPKNDANYVAGFIVEDISGNSKLSTVRVSEMLK